MIPKTLVAEVYIELLSFTMLRSSVAMAVVSSSFVPSFGQTTQGRSGEQVSSVALPTNSFVAFGVFRAQELVELVLVVCVVFVVSVVPVVSAALVVSIVLDKSVVVDLLPVDVGIIVSKVESPLGISVGVRAVSVLCLSDRISRSSSSPSFPSPLSLSLNVSLCLSLDLPLPLPLEPPPIDGEHVSANVPQRKAFKRREIRRVGYWWKGWEVGGGQVVEGVGVSRRIRQPLQ